MAEEKKNKGEDLGRVLKSKMGPPIAKTIVSYIPIFWIQNNMDKLQLGTVWAWLINKLLPNTGFGQDLSDISSDVLATQIIEMAKDKEREWKSAKQKLFNKRLQEAQGSGKKAKQVIDDPDDLNNDIEEIKKHFDFPHRDFDKKKMQDILDTIKKIDLKKINLGKIDLSKISDFLKDLDQKITNQKIPEKIDNLTNKINKSQPSKPFLKPNKISNFFDQITDKLNHS